MTWRVLRALVLLTGNLLRRVFREGLVVRAMTFPLVVVVGTLVATVGLFVMSKPPRAIGVPTGTHDVELVEVLGANNFTVREFDDPRQAVLDGEVLVAVGTEGQVIANGSSPETMLVESVLRRRHPESWQIDAQMELPGLEETQRLGLIIARILVGVLTLNAVVLGAGIVARDRDEGTLSVELAMPLPQWLHGASRWLAATLTLSWFSLASIATVGAFMGLPDPAATMRHTFAAIAASTALGLGAIGRRGLKSGFAGPLSFALAMAFGLFAVGRTLPSLAAILPIASLTTDTSGWLPCAVALLFGGAAILRFAYADSE